MTLKHEVRLWLRRFGVDVSRFHPSQSHDARMQARFVAFRAHEPTRKHRLGF